ncbi:transcriptional regulator [Pyrodictium delaneyi]|uniref:Transcriptional regulator n=1 Tax=Pyrodictium delaneyi TaxID=1273541 RepID=A0A211YQI2_9CREN|nr:transcriptional regulator [Pyrodictium delaneyi]
MEALSLEDTIRKRIIRILLESKTPLTAREIAELAGIDPVTGEHEVYIHLKHIAKSLRRSHGGRAVLYMIPPRCRNCGYVFTDLDSPKKPSKCPMCKSQRIEPPRFYIEAED